MLGLGLGLHKNRFVGGGGTSLQYFVRPSGATYGDGSGTSYDNAWSGFTSINWALLENQTLNVCGNHTETLIVGANCTIEMNNASEIGYIDALNLDYGIYVKDYNITGNNLNVANATPTLLDPTETANIYFENSTSHIYNAISNNCQNQGFQHWSGAHVTYHGNIVSNNNNDEGISGHLDSVIILAEDCHFESKNNFQSAINITNDSTAIINGTVDFSGNGYGTTTNGDILLTSSAICTINSNVSIPKINATATSRFIVNAGTYGLINTINTAVIDITNSFIDTITTRGGTMNVSTCYINNLSCEVGVLNLEDSYIQLNSKSNIFNNGTANITRCLFENGTNTDQMISNLSGTLNMNYCIMKGAVLNKWSILIDTASVSSSLNNITIDALGIGRGISWFKYENTTFSNLIITNVAIAIGVVRAGYSVTAQNCMFWNCTAKNTSAGTLTEVNSINANPLFIDSANDNYALSSGSQGIETGVTLSNATGILSANWGNSTTTPIVTTKDQGTNWNRGAYVN